MLKIIPKPTTNKGLYVLPGDVWEGLFKPFDQGIYFRYYENEIINFEFFHTLNKIIILDGPFSSEFTKEEMKAFFDSLVNLDELWSWMDEEVEFKVLKCMDPDDDRISGIWKMTEIFTIPKELNSLMENYYEFQVSTNIVRSMPYNCWTTSKIKIDISDEENKLYWITLCLLKYQRQLEQQSGE